jgi:hypothetical protein
MTPPIAFPERLAHEDIPRDLKVLNACEKHFNAIRRALGREGIATINGIDFPAKFSQCTGRK